MKNYSPRQSASDPELLEVMLKLTEAQKSNVRSFLVWSVPAIWRVQEDAATALGVSQEYFCQAKGGSKPAGIHMAARIAKATRLTLEDVIEGRAIGLIEARNKSPVTHRQLTPTPKPSSTLRAGGSDVPFPSRPNRDRAAQILAGRRFRSDRVEEALALAAYDGRLAPCNDPSVGWWLEASRPYLLSESEGS